MKTNRVIKILTILVVIAFCLIQTRYQNEPSSSIILVVCYLLKGMDWSGMISNYGTRIFGVTAIGILALNISILIAAIMNKRRILFVIALMHIGFWFFIWEFYGSFIILFSAIPYFVLATTLVGLLVITWLKGKMNKSSVS